MAPIATVPVVSPLRNWRRDDSVGAFAALVFAFSSLFFFSTFGLSGYLETVLNFSNNLNVWGRPSEKTVYVVLADFQPLLAVRRAIRLSAKRHMAKRHMAGKAHLVLRHLFTKEFSEDARGHPITYNP
jgi:hypothetical protein